MSNFREAINEKVLVFDGAVGTMLQEQGLEPGAPPELALLEMFETVAELQGEYAEAGADIITTNSFGGNRLKAREFGLEDRLEEINRLAVRSARKHTKGAYVAADMGPTGKFVEPVGDLAWDEAVEVYTEQARIFVDEGVDLFIFETMTDIRELKAGVVAVKSLCDLPIVANMTFDESGRSTLGSPPEVAAVVLDSLGVDVIGSNCSVGPDFIHKWLAAMRSVTAKPLIAMPNAGLPGLVNGKTVFPLGPDGMAEWVDRFLDLGCSLIGSCCGSTPDHTRAIVKELDRLGRTPRKPVSGPHQGATYLASRTKVFSLGPGLPAAAVGERINPTGRKALADELKSGGLETVRREARDQEKMGVDLIDINVGVPGIDEPAMLSEAVQAVEAACGLPIVLDSADAMAIETALNACAGKPLINSVRGERAGMKALLPLAKKHGAAVLGLCMDDKGIPADAKGRIKIAKKIIRAAVKAGIPENDVLLDPVTVPASADPTQALAALESLKYFSEKLGRGTLQGVSNISFGLPRRGALNAAYMSMAFAAGLNATFVNPADERVMEIYYASRVLAGQDVGAKDYIRFNSRHVGESTGVKKLALENAASWEDELREAVIDGEAKESVRLVETALANGVSPMDISDKAMTPAIQEVGRLFEKGDLFLPNLMLSAAAMEAGMELVNKAIEASAGVAKSRGVAVIATVEGDIHDIGKNIVVTVLKTNGWKVIDLGRGVPAKRIVKEAVAAGADVVGLSALMTTTVVRMPETINLLHSKGIPVMVGGAVLTDEYSKEIGADFYGKDAMAALHGAEKLKK